MLFYTVDSADQFWAELAEIADGNYYSASNLDQALSVYLRFASLYTDKYLVEDQDLAKCAILLLHSRIFSSNRGYARRKLIHVLANDDFDESNFVAQKILVGGVLLVDGRAHSSTLEMMQEEAATSSVVQTLWRDRYTNARLHRLFLELLYEMCRVQRIHDLEKIRPEFIDFLFEAIETSYVSSESSDPYNTAALMAICALNEQYMIAGLVSGAVSTATSTSPTTTNQVFECLCRGSDKYKTFGENLVFTFNRGADNCLQLMMLKLLYLIFTTPQTYNYFYVNDVKVLVDVFLRELDNLAREDEMLRNAYLRVLGPMLSNTSNLAGEQYKRADLVRLLECLVYPVGPALITETTQRLAYRCLKTEWLEHESPEISPITSRSSSTSSELTPAGHAHHPNATTITVTHTSMTATPPPPPPRKKSSTILSRCQTPMQNQSHNSVYSPRNTITSLQVPPPSKPSIEVRSSSVVDIATTLASPESMENLLSLSRSRSPRPAPPPPRKTPTPLNKARVGVS